MERGGGAQTARHLVRGHGRDGSAHHRSSPQAVGAPVLLGPDRKMPRHYHSYSDLPHSLPLFPLSGVLLLPRGQLPLNVFEPRYLEMVDYAMAGDRLIGMIQPAESEGKGAIPRLTQVGCAGKIMTFRETEVNRYLITLNGICRFRLSGEMPAATPWRARYCDFAAFAGDLAQPRDEDFPRARLLKALQNYLSSRD